MRRSLFLVLSITALLGGCSTPPMQPDYLNQTGSLSTVASAGRALAMLPASAGAVVQLLEERHSNGVVQRIILRGDLVTSGENKLTVSALTSFEGQGSDPLKLQPPTDQIIDRELTELFPKMRMSVADTLDRNGNGPFGYALGKGGRTTCLYAWQYVGGGQASAGLLSGVTPTLPIDIRVRLCRTGVSADALVGLVRQLVVVRPDGSGSYASAPSSAAMLGGDALASAGYGASALDTGMGRTTLYNTPLATYSAPVAEPVAEPVAAPNMRRRYRYVMRRPHRRRVYASRVIVQAAPRPVGAAVPLPTEIGAAAPPTAVRHAPRGAESAIPLPD